MKRVFAVMLALMLAVVSFAPAYAESAALTAEQENAIAMLNYITVLTRDINASKNSRLYLEEAYSSLINNVYPNAVDGETLEQLTGLLDVMEHYRMLDVKRERIQYIYEQGQAQAVLLLFPHPIDINAFANAKSGAQLGATTALMVADAVLNYVNEKNRVESEYMRSGWNLGDEETAVLHDSRKNTFSYMVKMVGEYDLPGELTLTERLVRDFVDWKNNANVVGRIQFLESNQSAYQSYGGYWLVLAESYYQNGNCEKCLEAIKTYESLGTKIFRKDYDLARVLPIAITAAETACGEEEYAALAGRYAQAILDNTDHKDWALRLFAAETFVSLAQKTGERSYLEKAYGIIKDNVNDLAVEQAALNAAYLAPVQQQTIPKGASKDEKKQINDFNNMLKEIRKSELAPVSASLRLNCELLLSLARELDLSDAERQTLDGVLHPNGAPIFLVPALDRQYWFGAAPEETAGETGEIEFGGTTIILPAAMLTDDSEITVTVLEKDAEEAVVLTDWTLEQVHRENDADISTFSAVYTSQSAREHQWGEGSAISVDIRPLPDDEEPTCHFEYTTEAAKSEWYDWLKVWEGHHNNWYDYAKVWENSVNFVPAE